MGPERIKRFWAKVTIKSEDECWIWFAGTSSKGYGSFAIDIGKSASAHKISWAMAYNDGIMPDPKMHVMHSCDVKRCVNPKHLSLGTPKDNAQDALKKGRLYNPNHSDKPFCKNGHPRTPENTHHKYKTCILCKREADRKSNQRRRLKDPAGMNTYHREYYHKNKAKKKE